MARSRPGFLAFSRADGTEEQIALREEVVTLGRADSCTIRLSAPTVSRVHARIETRHEQYILCDAGSRNGTFVNGARLTGEHVLSTGDQIWLGSPDVGLRFSDPEQTLMLPVRAAPPALLVDEGARTVHVYGAPASLSPLEYNLLHHLARHAPTVCTREECFLAAWGQPYDHATCEDALNTCVAKLRRNLRSAAESAGHEPPTIITLPRFGFRLDADVAFSSPDDHPTNAHSRVGLAPD